jgi:hypothetical protein
MGQPIDRVQDTGDANDQDNSERCEASIEYCETSVADNNTINQYYRNLANNDSKALPKIDAPSDSPKTSDSSSVEHSPAKVESAIAKEIKELRDPNAGPGRLSDVEKAIKDGKIRDANGNRISEEQQRLIARTIRDRTAIEMENALILEQSSNPIKRAIDNLIATAGNDLPEDFEGRAVEFLSDQFRQREANRMAGEENWKDLDGNYFVALCAMDDDDSTADEKLAAVFDNFTKAYEKNELGQLSGTAANAYSNDEVWKYEWRSCMEGVLTPVEEDDQAQIGSCAMNTQITPACKRRPDLVSEELCSLMTTGSWDSPFGASITVSEQVLGRGGPQNSSGQKPFVFLFNAGLSVASYGEQNGIPHMNGNNTTVMSEGARSLFGAGVEDGIGSWDRFSPGHSMVAYNTATRNGRVIVQQDNHWNGMGDSEPGQGLDHDYGKEIDLGVVDEAVAQIITA